MCVYVCVCVCVCVCRVLIPGGGRSLFFSRFARVGRAVVEMAMEVRVLSRS